MASFKVIKEISFKEAVSIMIQHKIVKSLGENTIILENGWRLTMTAEHEDDWSEYTPGYCRAFIEVAHEE